MSRFQGERLRSLTPYTPGEQSADRQYVKLNTNESPFPPSARAIAAATEAAGRMQLYCDPTCRRLTDRLAEVYGISSDEIICTNGSDEALDFVFQAFCDACTPAVFADITYGFYPVFAARNAIPFQTVPLKRDFTIDITDYFSVGKCMIVIANPNAPTGLALSKDEIEQILIHNRDNVVVIDEAYIDFGGESCVPLIAEYDNLLVTQTFSKSRSLAGGRLGFAMGNAALIADLHRVRYSTNPYNVNGMTQAAGYGVLCDEEYTRNNCQTIIHNRIRTTAELRKRGFEVLDSKTNFVFAKHPDIDGDMLYAELKKRGVLVRHFNAERIKNYNRITIGSTEQMDFLIEKTDEIITQMRR